MIWFLFSIISIFLLVNITFDWIFKSKSRFGQFLRFILILFAASLINLIVYHTPMQIRELTTQVNTLTRQIEILEQSQIGAKP